MTKRLNQLGSTTPKLHATRFKEELLGRLLGLQAHKKGRDVLLIFRGDVGPALLKASEITGALHVSMAAEIVRSDILERSMKFDGSLEEDCMETYVPQSLIELVSMIEHSPDIETQIETETIKSDLAIPHLLQYNCHQSPKKRSYMLQKHAKSREAPFVIYVGLLLFAKTRKRQLIDILHQYGICISYDRVLEVSSQLAEALVERYLEEGLVCPTVLRKGLFTKAAVDNVDHNPSATTAKSSFHGTGISLFQHPTGDNSGEPREMLHIAERPSAKKVPPLPESYINVRPAYFTATTPLLPKRQNLPPLKPDSLYRSLDMEFQ